MLIWGESLDMTAVVEIAEYSNWKTFWRKLKIKQLDQEGVFSLASSQAGWTALGSSQTGQFVKNCMSGVHMAPFYGQ